MSERGVRAGRLAHNKVRTTQYVRAFATEGGHREMVELGGKGQTNHLSGEFDPGSERTLAAGLTHASRARTVPSGTY